MEAVQKLHQALSKNYYKTFIVSLHEESEIDFKQYWETVMYKGEEYLEKHIYLLRDDSKKIINEINPLYYDAIREIYIKISNTVSVEEKLNYITNTISLFNIPLIQLRKDMLIDNPDSNYYSKINIDQNYFSNTDLHNKIINTPEEEGIQTNKIDDFKDPWFFEYFNLRTKFLSYLPLSLYLITINFVKLLHENLDKIKATSPGNIDESNFTKLKWNSKPSHLGYLIGMLADLDYLHTPQRPNGETNYTQLAKDVLTTFNIDTTEATLSKYLNISSEKAQETDRNFKKAKFYIPHKKEVN